MGGIIPPMDQFTHDLAYAGRRLWRAPGFTFVAVLTLALGIGANTALFSLINGLLFRSLPVPNLDRIVALSDVERSTGRIFNSVSGDALRAIADTGASPFEQLALRDPLIAAVSNAQQAERVTGELVSGNYFQTVGVMPLAGRLLQPADDRESGSDTPVVISERLWRRWFNANPAAIGQTMTLAGYPLVIVGVSPDTFKGTWIPTLMAADVWLPVRVSDQVVTVQRTAGMPVRTAHGVLATLRSGVSMAQADAAAGAIGRQVSSGDSHGLSLAVLPGRRAIMPQEFDQYGALLGSALVGLSGLVFLIACANLTNLFLARGVARSGEMAVRMAIGASRERIFRLFLTETVLVTVLAGAAGLVLAFATTYLMTTIPLPALDGIVIRFDPSPDLHVFGYALLIALVAGLAVGIVPARQAARTEPLRVLAAGGAGGATTRGRRLRTRLVASQVAMSVVLLVGAGLYVRSALAALHFDPGYEMSAGAMASVDFSLHKIDEVRGRAVLSRMLEAARRLPGVERAALASALPAAGPSRYASLLPEGQVSAGRADVYAGSAQVSPGFFQTVGIPIRRGRDFADTDGPGAPPVIIVSERVAKRFWPGQDPIGRRLGVGSERGLFEIIGVAADTATSLTGTSTAYVYRPVAQSYSPKMSVVIRAPGRPATLLEPLRQALRAVDSDVAVFDVRTVADSVGLLLVPIRLTALVLGTLGVLAFGIAVIGVYGVMAFVVSQRTREFGVHKALGASESQIHAMVLRQGFRMLIRGVLPGLVLALIGAGFLQHILYGVQPRDPLTFVVIPLVLLTTGLAACYLPARRAARVDPNVALRDL
jgi:predicted permease